MINKNQPQCLNLSILAYIIFKDRIISQTWELEKYRNGHYKRLAGWRMDAKEVRETG